MSEFHDNYSLLDKVLHRVAFNSVGLQLRLSDVESEEHKGQLKQLRVEKPVFITALPRAGTTILLEVLSKTGVFCHHTYKDMPFVFTPLLWQKFSSRFAKSDELTERAHGDGIKINQDSPEAFEEMFYKGHWPERYRYTYLSVWTDEKAKPAFDSFFHEHIRKLMLRDDKSRYLSKNNFNILRLPYLKRLFPDGCFVVPFRDPLQHAMSLHRQHQNFLRLHNKNSFAKSYMAGIGHFDFGVNLKAIDFDGWLDECPYATTELDFWLAYWIACYEHLLNYQDFVEFVCFEQLCSSPESELERLAGAIEIDPKMLLAQSGQIKAGKSHDIDSYGLSQENVAKAQALYRRLSGQS